MGGVSPLEEGASRWIFRAGGVGMYICPPSGPLGPGSRARADLAHRIRRRLGPRNRGGPGGKGWIGGVSHLREGTSTWIFWSEGAGICICPPSGPLGAGSRARADHAHPIRRRLGLRDRRRRPMEGQEDGTSFSTMGDIPALIGPAALHMMWVDTWDQRLQLWLSLGSKLSHLPPSPGMQPAVAHPGPESSSG